MDVSASLDAYLRQATARREFNGTVLIALGGRILLRKAYGWADLRQRRPNRVRTRFRVSLLSTDVMFMALLQLVDRGRLDLDDSLCEHIKPCPRRWRPITVRLLVDGRSGLPSARPLPRRTRTIAEWIAALGAWPLAFQPARDGAAPKRECWSEHTCSRSSRGRRGRATSSDGSSARRECTRRRPIAPICRAARRRTSACEAAAWAPGPRSLPSASPTFSTGSPRPWTTCTGSSGPDGPARSSHADCSRRSSTPGAAPAGTWPDHFAHLGHGPRGTSDGWYTALARDGEEKLTIVTFSNMGGYSLSDVVHRIGLIAAGWPPARALSSPTVLARATGDYFRWDSSKRRTVTTSVRTRPDGTLELSSDEPSHPGSGNSALRNARWRWVVAPTADGAFFATGEELWWGIRVHLEPRTAPNGDSRVVRFVSFGSERRYRRSI
jgi:Beta-lactamase